MKSLETNLFLLYGLVEVNRAWHHVHPETAKLRELCHQSHLWQHPKMLCLINEYFPRVAATAGARFVLEKLRVVRVAHPPLPPATTIWMTPRCASTLLFIHH